MGRFRGLKLQFTYPDIAEAGLVVVILQLEGELFRMWFILGKFLMLCWAQDFCLVLNEDPVVEDGDKCRGEEGLSIEARRLENDVIGQALPTGMPKQDCSRGEGKNACVFPRIKTQSAAALLMFAPLCLAGMVLSISP